MLPRFYLDVTEGILFVINSQLSSEISYAYLNILDCIVGEIIKFLQLLTNFPMFRDCVGIFDCIEDPFGDIMTIS